MLRIYNSLTQEKEDFVSRVPGKVGMYVCGMTVYDFCHIGHGRIFVVFDMVSIHEVCFNAVTCICCKMIVRVKNKFAVEKNEECENAKQYSSKL